MVKATLLGLEPSTSASQRVHCPPDVRLAPLFFLSTYLSSLHLFSPLPCHSLVPLLYPFISRRCDTTGLFSGLCGHFQPCHGSLACFPSKFKEHWFFRSLSLASSSVFPLFHAPSLDSIHLTACLFMPACRTEP